jgi:hypothetical protein
VPSPQCIIYLFIQFRKALSELSESLTNTTVFVFAVPFDVA